jgi:Hypothetical protein (DUF2513)
MTTDRFFCTAIDGEGGSFQEKGLGVMERDMELVRKILLVLEQHPRGHAPERLAIEGYDDETVGYHVFLMGQDQGGLLHVAVTTVFGGASPQALAEHITWKGHEFLDSVKNETVWQRVKAAVVKKGGGASLEVVTALAVETAKTYFLEP